MVSGLTSKDILAAVDMMEKIASDRSLLIDLSPSERTRLMQAARTIFSPDVHERRQYTRAKDRRRKNEKIRRIQADLNRTGIRELRRKPVYMSPNIFPPGDFKPADVPESAEFREAAEPQHCYICKEHYSSLHHFYDQLCPSCAEFNFRKRTESADLSGRVALLTGGRVKIGYQAGLKLLRAGAHLIISTRFPHNSAERYAAEPDFSNWKERLEIYGLDLRHTPSVEAFCRHLLTTRTRLDYIINNACQTVRRPPGFYEHMMEKENASLHALPAAVQKLVGNVTTLTESRLSEVSGLVHAAELSQITLLPNEGVGQKHLFPQGRLDQDKQQIDLREQNSWRLMLSDVSAVELLEVQLVNAVAPFILNARLKPLMVKTSGRDKHIVNVSAVEGQFYRKFKTTRHPHTNMAKAALNMMTRTSAADYQADGIHMNSVDTGWVTDEDTAAIAARKVQEQRFHPPLDIIDGAARIVDPIIDGHNTGRHVWGHFLKDYKPTDW